MDNFRIIMDTTKKNTLKLKLIIFVTFVIVFTSIPYFIGFQNNSAEYKFSGFLFGVEDGNSYIAKMFSGAAGDWLFRSPYSSTEQNGVLAFLPYILLGKLAGGQGIHDQLLALFQLFRISGIIVLTLAYTKFLKIFFKEDSKIILGLIILLIGSGWDWILMFTGVDRIALSFYSPETFGFLSVLGLPHLCFSRALMIFGFVPLFSTDTFDDPKIYIKSGILFLLSALFQPINLVISYLVFGIWWLVNLISKKFAFSLELFVKQALSIIISLPFTVYYVYIMTQDDYMKAWTAQNILNSPPFIDYVLAFLPLIILTVLSLLRYKGKFKLVFDHNKLILIIWFVLSLILVYMPMSIQRRLLDGVWVSVVILILSMMDGILSSFGKKLFIIGFFLSPLILYIGSVSSISNPTIPQYSLSDRVLVYDELAQKTSSRQVILAPFAISNEIPAYVNLRVVTGHGPESLNKDVTNQLLDDLYYGEINKNDLCSYVKAQKVDYIWFAAEDYRSETLSGLFMKNELQLMIDQNNIKVLKISDECGYD